MNHEHYFDQLTRLAAGGVPRREALRRFGAVVGGALLGSLGLGRSISVAQTAGNSQGCAVFCRKYRSLKDLKACLATCQTCASPTQMCGGTSINSVTCCTSGNCVNGVCGPTVNVCAGVICPPIGSGICAQTRNCDPSAGAPNCDLISPPTDGQPCGPSGPCGSQICQSGTCTSINAPNGTACDDGNACTVSDSCQNGVCQGIPVSCDDGNPCTIDVCNPGSGCIHIPNPGIPCPGGTCDGGGTCVPSEPCPNPEPSSQCMGQPDGTTCVHSQPGGNPAFCIGGSLCVPYCLD